MNSQTKKTEKKDSILKKNDGWLTRILWLGTWVVLAVGLVFVMNTFDEDEEPEKESVVIEQKEGSNESSNTTSNSDNNSDEDQSSDFDFNTGDSTNTTEPENDQTSSEDLNNTTESVTDTEYTTKVYAMIEELIDPVYEIDEFLNSDLSFSDLSEDQKQILKENLELMKSKYSEAKEMEVPSIFQADHDDLINALGIFYEGCDILLEGLKNDDDTKIPEARGKFEKGNEVMEQYVEVLLFYFDINS